MLNNLSIGKRLIFGFGLLILILLATNLVAMMRAADIMDDMNILVEDRMLKIREANQINLRTMAVGRLLRGLLLADTSEERAAIKSEVEGLRAENAKSMTVIEERTHLPEGKALLEKTKVIRERAGKQYAQFFELADKDTALAKAFVKKELTPTMNEFIADANAMVEFQNARMHEAVEHDRQTYANARTATIAILLASIAIAGVTAFWIIRSVAGPLSSIRDAIEHVRNSNDFTHTVPVSSKDEVGMTAEAFNELLATMRHTLGALRQATYRIDDASQQLASGAQQSA